ILMAPVSPPTSAASSATWVTLTALAALIASNESGPGVAVGEMDGAVGLAGSVTATPATVGASVGAAVPAPVRVGAGGTGPTAQAALAMTIRPAQSALTRP